LLLQDGQLVTFSEVVGMTELNSQKPVKIKNCKVPANLKSGVSPESAVTASKGNWIYFGLYFSAVVSSLFS
jgi:hypothetical protein